ncbi:hypothetical protein EXD76_04170 [BEV proteobacterium]|nr:hypothetical protein [Candidatus Symbiopectobacterium sp. Chty_BC]
MVTPPLQNASGRRTRAVLNRRMVATDTYFRANRARKLENGFVQAVFDPSLNALASAMATARHGFSRTVEQGPCHTA